MDLPADLRLFSEEDEAEIQQWFEDYIHNMEVEAAIKEAESSKIEAENMVRNNKRKYFDLVAPLASRVETPETDRGFVVMGKRVYKQKWYQANKASVTQRNLINLHLKDKHADSYHARCTMCAYAAHVDSHIESLRKTLRKV